MKNPIELSPTAKINYIKYLTALLEDNWRSGRSLQVLVFAGLDSSGDEIINCVPGPSFSKMLTDLDAAGFPKEDITDLYKDHCNEYLLQGIHAIEGGIPTQKEIKKPIEN